MMTREEKLYAMRGAELIQEAERLNIKVAHKGTSLKESKEKVIKKILAAEAAMDELMAQAEEVAEPTLSVPMPIEKTDEEPEVTEPMKTRVTKRTRTKKTFESLLKNVPLLSNVSISPNGSKRNAVHINTENGKRRIFGYDGAVIVVTRTEYLHGVVDIISEKKNYGYRVAPTAENMIGIQKNYLATLA